MQPPVSGSCMVHLASLCAVELRQSRVHTPRHGRRRDCLGAQVASPLGSAMPAGRKRRMLTLYFAPGSSSMAPHIALHEIGAPFESRPLSFRRKQNRDPAYLAINPEGKVPTLLIDDRLLTEVAAILFYLARRFPE